MKDRYKSLKEENLKTERWKCYICNKIFESRRMLQKHKKEMHPFESRIGWAKGLTKENSEIFKKISNTLKSRYAAGVYKPSFKGKHHSEKSKKIISEKRKAYLIANPDQHPYRKFTHKNGKSYAESYFENWLISNNFSFISEYAVGLYHLDFLVNGVYDLEIDGQFHRNDPKKIEIDKVRAKYLENIGYKTIRVYWPDYSKLNKEERAEYLNLLKDILSNTKEIEKLDNKIKDFLLAKKRVEENKKIIKKIKNIQRENKNNLLIEKIKNIVNSGEESVCNIANIVGVSHTHVRRICTKYNIPLKKRKSPSK